jgi:Helix-turn-helix.
MGDRRVGLERVQVAATLRRMREDEGISRDQAADELGCTVSKIGDIETGRSGVKPAELERLLELYRAPEEERPGLIATARVSRTRRPRTTHTVDVPAGHRRFTDLEAQAVSAIYYSPELISGVLQTPAYARAVLEWSDWHDQAAVERRLALRMERGRVLCRTDRPSVSYWCILGEAALRTNVGGPVIMREQLDHLLTCANSMANLVVQVLPSGTGPHVFMGMTLTLLRFAPPAPDIVHVEAPDQDRFIDREAEVARIAARLELLKAKALSREDSLDLMAHVTRGCEESNHA